LDETLRHFPTVFLEFRKPGDAQIIFSVDPICYDSGAGNLPLRTKNISGNCIIRLIAVIKDERNVVSFIGGSGVLILPLHDD
jgi:hypothetical protein